MNETVFEWVVRVIVMTTALPVHECAHALVASWLGDDTAGRQGRLTLNPFVHLDLLGSLLLVFSGFGWAKPVPVNPRKFKNPRRDMALSALAGPVSNVLLATVLMVVYKILIYTVDIPALRYQGMADTFMLLLLYMIVINLNLAVFNFLPVPPLDGSKIFGALMPDHIYFTMMQFEKYVMLLVFVLIWTDVLSQPLGFLVKHLFSFINLITSPIDMLFA